MTIAPHSGIVDFGTFTSPAGGLNGIQGEVPAPLVGQETYVLTANGWSATGGGGGGTVTQINTGTGLSGGPITSSGTISLANTAVTPGAYTNANITVDQQGRVTLASNGAAGGVTSFSGGSTGLTPNTATTGAITLAGTLAVLNGGTGVTTSTGTGSVVLSTGPTFSYFGVNSYTSTTPVLGFNASNSPTAIGASVANSYLQVVVQNTSSTSGASTNYVLSNDLGTDSSYYGEFGMNSSIYSSGTPADFYSINNGIYFSGHDGDLSVGSGNGFKTYFPYASGANAHVINNSGALGFNTNLAVTSGTTGFGSAGQVLVTGGSASAPAWNANLTISSGALTVGVAGTQAGTLLLSGATSGTTTLAVASAASGTLTLPAGTGTAIATATNMAANPVTGTPSSTTYLRGDGTWAAVPASSLTIGTTATSGGAAGQIMFDTGSVLQESSSLLWDNTNQALTATSIANPVVPTLRIAGASNFTGTALTGVSITGTGGQFSCNAASLVVGQFLTISGTLGGTGTITGYANPTTYLISATNGSTTFTLVVASTGAAIVTTAGTPTGLTYTVTAPLASITETWNNSTVAFTGLKLNVTDTASNASSLFMDFQVSGSSKVSIRKDGSIYFASTNTGLGLNNSTLILGNIINPAMAVTGSTSVQITAFGQFGFATGNPSSYAAPDAILTRRAAANLRFGAADTNTSATVTITIAAPGVVTWTSHNLTTGSPVNFSTTGALPTGITAGTNYYIIYVDANNFQLATTAANAFAGTAITTSGTQSGVQTGYKGPVSQVLSVQSLSTGATNLAGAPLRITGSQGTGSAAGGDIVFQVAPAGSANTFTVTFTNGSSTIAGTGLPTTANTPVAFTTTGALPTNFAINTTYYILAGSTSTAITVAATVGGTAIVAGSAGSGTQTLTQAVAQNSLATALTITNARELSFNNGFGTLSTSNYFLTSNMTASFTTVKIGGDIFLWRRAAANLQLGNADAAAPVAQTLSVQSVVAGTSNTAGANLTITGSQGTGTGVGGNIAFQVATAGTTGTAQNALATAFVVNQDKTVSLTGFTVAGLPTAGTVGRFAYVTDATAPVWNSTLTGGGSSKVLVFDNGTNWVAM